MLVTLNSTTRSSMPGAMMVAVMLLHSKMLKKMDNDGI